MGSYLSILFLFVALIFVSPSSDKIATANYSHEGAIVEYETFRPLVVDAHAYQSVRPVTTTACPSFGTPLHDTQSDQHGHFEFVLSAQSPSYGAVFCRNGFTPRIEPNQDNTANSSPVRPVPIQMYPVARRKQLPNDVKNEMNKFVSDLTYLRSIDPEEFDKALREWGEQKNAKPFVEEFLKILQRDRG